MARPLLAHALLSGGLSLLAACDPAASKSVPFPEVGGGKADAADRVAQLEDLTLGEARADELTHDLEFHGYVVRLPAGAEITAEVTHLGSSSALDTTLFVFGPGLGNRGFGDDAIAFDDDSGWGALSRIRELTIPALGEYLVVVGSVPGDRARGHYRLAVECTNDACDLFDPGQLEVCDDTIIEAVDECIAELTFDTQDPEFAIRNYTEEGNFTDIYDWLCHDDGAPDWCGGGLQAFVDTMVPVCQEEFGRDFPTSDLSLTPVTIPSEMDEFIFEADDCDFCTAGVQAYTYAGDDPTPREAAEAIRAGHDHGFNFFNEGAVSADEAQTRMEQFDGFVPLANALAQSDAFSTAMLSATFFPAPSVDEFVNHLVMLYPATNHIIVLEQSFFSE